MKNAITAIELFLLAAILTLALAGCTVGGDRIERFADAAPEDGGSIDIPGYESLTFKAGSKTQRVNLTNPPENDCAFVLSLVLNDTGETLWTGEALKPGKAFTRIKLQKALEAGSYEATIKYECFTLTDNTPLNGAEIKVTLVVA